MQEAYLLMFESELVADAASSKLRALHTINNNIPDMRMTFNAQEGGSKPGVGGGGAR
jgi:hypothetical protein